MLVISTFVARSASVSVIAASLLLGASHVDANPIVQFDIQVSDGYSNSFSQVGAVTPTAGVFNFDNAASLFPGGIIDPDWAILGWDFDADEDPDGVGDATGARLGSVFSVQNTSANDLSFSITVSMNVLPAAATFYGAGASFTLAPNDNSTGTLSTTNQFNAGQPMWDYLVNGSSFTSLFSTGYSLNAVNGFTNSDAGGIGGPTVGPTITSIGIRLDFKLSAGEIATFDGVFSYIPAPGALALLAFAGLVGTRRRR